MWEKFKTHLQMRVIYLIVQFVVAEIQKGLQKDMCDICTESCVGGILAPRPMPEIPALI